LIFDIINLLTGKIFTNMGGKNQSYYHEWLEEDEIHE